MIDIISRSASTVKHEVRVCRVSGIYSPPRQSRGSAGGTETWVTSARAPVVFSTSLVVDLGVSASLVTLRTGRAQTASSAGVSRTILNALANLTRYRVGQEGLGRAAWRWELQHGLYQLIKSCSAKLE